MAKTASLMDLFCGPGVRRAVMNEGLVTVAGKGLRIEVAPGKEWALSVVTQVQLPFGAERIRLSIEQLSPGARAIIKLVGDFDGSGRAKTVLPLEPMAHAGEWQQDLDARVAFHLRETDYFHGRAFPTYLYFNPFGESRTVEVDVGPAVCDLYDAVAHRFIKREAKDKGVLDLAPDAAALIVVTPAGAAIAREGRLLRAGDAIVDYAYE